ncbi:hypothetical protein ABZV91_01585 [Nocardia sp. NPDC004568]|uniref:hypothetical protein n=1 Tax=Nocardia sp. NPDC004568 TaxID=3154551 RepID=UPI0033AFD931
MPTTPLTQQSFQTVVSTDHIVLVDFCDRLEELVQQVRWMDIDEFRRERNIQQPTAAAPSAPATVGRMGPAPGPQAHGWPGPRSA